MEEVSSIWARYGVDIRTSDARESADEPHPTLVVTLSNVPSQLTVRDTLGSIRFVDDAPQTQITLYPREVDTLLSSASFFRSFDLTLLNVQHDTIVGRVLGRALAHEIGHFLLRSRDHSSFGLMRAHQSIYDLVGQGRERFSLSDDERMRLVAGTTHCAGEPTEENRAGK